MLAWSELVLCTLAVLHAPTLYWLFMYIRQKSTLKIVHACTESVCVCVCGCVYVCMRVCVCTYVRTYACMHVCMYVCLHVLTYIYTHTCIYLCIYICESLALALDGGQVRFQARTASINSNCTATITNAECCEYVRMYVCIYIHIHIYIHTYLII